MSEGAHLLKFSGLLPLFPLPNIVHFPNTLLPLHIFEKRYQQMLKDVLEGEKYIGMSVLKPGWDEHYQKNPDIYHIACLGKIIQHDPLDDGRCNILLLGLKRVLIQDVVSPYPYRTARVQILNDRLVGVSEKNQEIVRQLLLEMYKEYVEEFADPGKTYPNLSEAELNLGQLCDAISACVQFPVECMMKVLEELNVAERSKLVMNFLQEKIEKKLSAMDYELYVKDLPINLN